MDGLQSVRISTGFPQSVAVENETAVFANHLLNVQIEGRVDRQYDIRGAITLVNGFSDVGQMIDVGLRESGVKTI